VLPVEGFDDRVDAETIAEVLKNPMHDGGFGGMDRHAVSVRSRTPPAIHAHLANRHRAVSERGLIHGESPRLLSELTAKGLSTEYRPGRTGEQMPAHPRTAKEQRVKCPKKM
jgi:hypothetical protein